MVEELKRRVEAVVANNMRIIADMQPLKKQEPWMDNLELCFKENTALIKELFGKQQDKQYWLE